MLVDLPEYRMIPHVVQVIRVTEMDKLVESSKEGCLNYHDFMFLPDGDVDEGDFLVIRNGAISHYKPDEFNTFFEPNSRDNWNDDGISILQTGIDWAMAQLKSGWAIKRGDSTQIIYPDIVDCALKFFTRLDDGAVVEWAPTIDDLHHENWQVVPDFGGQHG